MKFALVSKKSKTSSVNFFNYKTTVFVFKKYQNFIDFKFNFKPVIIRKFSSDLLGEKHFTTIIQQYLPNSFINFKKRILFDNCFVCFFVNSYLLLHILEYGTFHFFYLKKDLFQIFLLKYVLNLLLDFKARDLIAIKFNIKKKINCTSHLISKKFIK
tara:strand:+ start:1851 stop:2321 length:471 start_codon:yes stop_codon:yes gene_type:complete